MLRYFFVFKWAVPLAGAKDDWTLPGSIQGHYSETIGDNLDRFKWTVPLAGARDD